MKNILPLLIFFLFASNSFSQHFKKDNKAFRKKMNKEFKDPNESPLVKEDLTTFKKLHFFALDESYRVEATLTINASPQLFKMSTSTDRLPVYSTYGELSFELNGEQYALQVYQNQQLQTTAGYEDYLFIPFADETNGYETYGGGRYLDFRIPTTDKIYIDFNKSYNPYCAYSDRYSCPKVPEANILSFRIEAGVMNWVH